MDRPRRQRADFVMALRFFSRLPAGKSAHEAPNLDRIAPALPFASLAIAAGPALALFVLAGLGVPGLASATLAVVLLALASGAMGEDALADSFDGLFGGQTRERRLEIMRDSRHGTFGLVSVCLALVLRIACLAALVEPSPLLAGAALAVAAVAGRSIGLVTAALLAPARADGAGATAGTLALGAFGLGCLITIVLVLAIATPGFGLGLPVLALAVASLVALTWTEIAKRRVGGQTGDLIGAGMLLAECAVLVVLAAA